MELESKNLRVLRNPNYRIGDILFKQNPKDTRNRQDIQIILTHDRYEGSLLKRYLEEERRLGLHQADEATSAHFNLFTRINKQYILERGLAGPDRDELVFHIRIGDKERQGNESDFKYLNVIKKAREIADIRKVTIVTCISFAQPIVTLANTEKRAHQASRYLDGLFRSITSTYPDLIYKLQSSTDVDEDFCYLSQSRYFVQSVGFFSKLAARVLDTEAIVFSDLAAEPVYVRPSSTLGDPAYD